MIILELKKVNKNSTVKLYKIRQKKLWKLSILLEMAGDGKIIINSICEVG